jgi:hypothetical protein
MRFVLAAVAFAAVTQSVQAQETTTLPPPPPSSCAAFTPAPSPPDGASATIDQVRAAVAGYETWQATTQATLDCRFAEVRALNAQVEARRNELVAAQADNTARATAFQAQLDIFSARQRR